MNREISKLGSAVAGEEITQVAWERIVNFILDIQGELPTVEEHDLKRTLETISAHINTRPNGVQLSGPLEECAAGLTKNAGRGVRVK